MGVNAGNYVGTLKCALDNNTMSTTGFPQPAEAGLYIFFFNHSFQINVLTKSVGYETWMHATFAKDMMEAHRSLEKAAEQMKLLENMRAHPDNLHFQMFAVGYLEGALDALCDQINQPKIAESDMALKTETVWRADTLKNALMKQIIESKNAELLQQSHHLLTPEEIQYLHDKITKN